jgi:hypothetical protein
MTNHARIGGILTIVAGAFGILGGFGVFLGVLIMRLVSSTSYTPYGSLFPAQLLTIIMAFYAVWGIFLGLLGVLGIVGGVFALRKKNWGVALAGAIAGAITFLLCGVPAVIFVTLAKPEFSARKPARRRRR